MKYPRTKKETPTQKWVGIFLPFSGYLAHETRETDS